MAAAAVAQDSPIYTEIRRWRTSPDGSFSVSPRVALASGIASRPAAPRGGPTAQGGCATHRSASSPLLQCPAAAARHEQCRSARASYSCPPPPPSFVPPAPLARVPCHPPGVASLFPLSPRLQEFEVACRTNEKDRVTLRVLDIKWSVFRRYSEFADLDK